MFAKPDEKALAGRLDEEAQALAQARVAGRLAAALGDRGQHLLGGRPGGLGALARGFLRVRGGHLVGLPGLLLGRLAHGAGQFLLLVLPLHLTGSHSNPIFLFPSCSHRQQSFHELKKKAGQKKYRTTP